MKLGPGVKLGPVVKLIDHSFYPLLRQNSLSRLLKLSAEHYKILTLHSESGFDKPTTQEFDLLRNNKNISKNIIIQLHTYHRRDVHSEQPPSRNKMRENKAMSARCQQTTERLPHQKGQLPGYSVIRFHLPLNFVRLLHHLRSLLARLFCAQPGTWLAAQLSCDY